MLWAKVESWTQPIDDFGFWWCYHSDVAGNLTSPTHLSVASATSENQQRVSSNRRASLYCPECGTHWRVWDEQRIAKYYISYPFRQGFSAHSSTPPRRLILRDIDRIITAISQNFPEVIVTQHQSVWPADDEGLWWFDLPGNSGNLQIESPSGMCPFIVETNDPNCENLRTLATIQEVVSHITDHLSAITQSIM